VKKVAVSRTPGKTKHFQTLHVPDHPMILCDCPGLVFPTFLSTRSDMVCDGLLRISEIKDHMGPIKLVCERIPRELLEKTYGIRIPRPGPGEFQNRPPKPEELLSLYAYIRGYMGGHGNPDQARAARYILSDYVDGKLLYCHPPPDCSQEDFFGTKSENNSAKTKSEEISSKTTTENPSDEADEEDEIVDESFEIDGDSIKGVRHSLDRNPFTPSERGKKFQRRQKEKAKFEGAIGVYTKGKVKQGVKAHDPRTGTPTNVKLVGKNSAGNSDGVISS